MNEEQLLKEIASDPRKFEQVYEAFYNKIFGYAFKRTTDYEAARDIAAETFLRAYANIGRFQWRNVSMLHWLYRIATNELNKFCNRQKYRPQSLDRIQEEYGIDIAGHLTVEAEAVRLQEDLDKHKEFLRLNAEIKKLGVKYQDVIALRFFEHKSIKEIALILEKNEGTIKSLLSRGIEQLKENFKRKI